MRSSVFAAAFLPIDPQEQTAPQLIRLYYISEEEHFPYNLDKLTTYLLYFY
jgi:hypothetical protein